MNAKQIVIKYNGFHKVTLTGNVLTGDHWGCEFFIQNFLGGKWNKESKVWTVDPALVKSHTDTDGYTKQI
jgi:hypothetical protein